MNFFVFGQPKSGTTWLQMLLNAHPEVSCRPEDQMGFFLNNIPSLLEAYNNIITQIDERTAKQGIDKFEESDAVSLFRYLVLMTLGKSELDVSGIKDNAILDRFELYHNLFPESKFIHIVRDPRDVVVSSWHHNMRVEGEAAFISRAHSLEEWSGTIAKLWAQGIMAVSGEERILSVKFEDLKADTTKVARRLFAFLGVNCSHAGKCVEATRFDKLAKSGNEFFRKGQTGSWKEELDDEMLELINKEAGSLMKEWGYV